MKLHPILKLVLFYLIGLGAGLALATFIIADPDTSNGVDCVVLVDLPVWFGGKGCMVNGTGEVPPPSFEEKMAFGDTKGCSSKIDLPVWFRGKACVEKDMWKRG